MHTLSHRSPLAGWSVLALLAVALVALFWGSATALADDGDHSGNDDTLVERGLIETMPAGGGMGAWRIGGKDYTVDADTEFEPENGAFEAGRCVAVFVDSDSMTTAEKIRSLPQGACTGNGGDDGGDDGHGDDHEFYGVIEGLPGAPDLVGPWVIDGTTYTATATTEFDREHGDFEVGGCVEVEVSGSDPLILKKVQSESDYKCRGSDDDDDGDDEYEGKLYGAITKLPAGPDFLGLWSVGDVTFTVTTATELEQEDVPFAVGVTVKVEFVEDNGEKVATEVKSIFKGDHGDDDEHEGFEGHAFGPIVSFPQGNVGTWDIGGITYTVTAETRIHTEQGPIATGANVRIRYTVDANGERIARMIKTTNDMGNAPGNGVFKFVGYIEVKPAQLPGTWTIGGGSFVSTDRTRYDDSDGLLVVGAWVEVTYRLVNGTREIVKMESATVPGSGDDDHAGVIDDDGSDDLSATAASANQNWSIDGRTYVVTPATVLDDGGGSLTVGSTVIVNSFTTASGAQVATRIAGITFVSTLYLPLAEQ